MLATGLWQPGAMAPMSDTLRMSGGSGMAPESRSFLEQIPTLADHGLDLASQNAFDNLRVLIAAEDVARVPGVGRVLDRVDVARLELCPAAVGSGDLPRNFPTRSTRFTGTL